MLKAKLAVHREQRLWRHVGDRPLPIHGSRVAEVKQVEQRWQIGASERKIYRPPGELQWIKAQTVCAVLTVSACSLLKRSTRGGIECSIQGQDTVANLFNLESLPVESRHQPVFRISLRVTVIGIACHLIGV